MIRTLVVLEGLIGRKLIAQRTGKTPVDLRSTVSRVRRGEMGDRGALPKDTEAQGARIRHAIGSSFGRRSARTDAEGARQPYFSKAQQPQVSRSTGRLERRGSRERERLGRALNPKSYEQERRPQPATPTFAKRVLAKKPATPSFSR